MFWSLDDDVECVATCVYKDGLLLDVRLDFS